LFSAVEAADALGVSVFSVRLWARTRRIPCRRLGSRLLFSTDDLDRIVKAALVPAREE